MKPRNHSFIPLRIPAAMVLLGSTWQVHAAFTAVDNFNTRSLGNISGQGGWLATNTTSVAVIVDPGNPINKVLRQSGDGDAGVALPAAIANATTGTYFFRMRVISTTNNTSFGLADSPLPVTTGQVGNFGSFEVQAQAINANLRGRDVATTFATPLNFQSTAWYKVWLVVNNTSDTWQMYVQSADDSGYATQTQLTPTDGTWNFRNAPASNAITTAQFTSDNGNAFLYFDDLYIDNAGVNLADPTFVADPDTDDDDLVDAWETFYFGNLAQGRNDDTENGGTGDGLTHFEEQTLGTSPLSADTDGDGLADGAEDDGMANPAFGNVRTNPLAADSDGDGASDGQETSGALNAAFANTPTDPNLSDTDGDGMPDFDETVYPSNPNDIASLPKLHALIGPAKRNGSFELLGGVTGATAEANHWDTDSDGDVDNWTLWPTVSSANGGGTDDAQSPSNGTRRTEVDVNNAAYNLSTYQVKEGDIIRVTWDHLATSSGTGNHTFWVAYDDGFGGILQFTPTATVSRAPGTASKLIYKVPAASPIIGKKIGVGVKAFANDQRIDNVVLTVVDGDSDGDELSDFWEDQNFGNNDENPTPGELVLQGKLDDPDGDTYNNLAEQAVGSNPNSAASNPGDTDGDGLADEWELTYAPDLATLTGSGDPDHDYATNEQEETGDSHPLLSVGFPDTDHDGLNDGWEKAHFTNLGTADIDSDSDGSINSLEMAAGSDPGNPASTPAKALLVHRWNFNGTLNDSAGTSHAQIVDADANPATGGGSSISATAVTLDGGLNTESDYVDLGTNLLQGKMTPVTIELWATQNTVQNWSRIFDLNNGTSNEYLMMSWSSGVNPNADSVEWKDTSITTRINSVAPYTPGTQYHIVMTILPAVHSGEAIGNGSRVVWYAAPVGSTSPLGQIQGSFDAPHHLSTFNDLHAWLGRSVFSVLPTPDSVAGATYDEVRIWDGALADVQRHVAQAAGPDAPDLVLDSEPDGLPDAWEIGFFGNTAQGNVDSDGDGQINSAELLAGSNPASITSVPGDADGDGLGDAWEFTNFGSFAATPGGDPDGDRDTNAVEFANDTNPVNKESFFSATADTVPDSWKAFYNISAQGSLSDLDEGPGDGIDNRTEFVRNTNPTLRDTDGDGLDDGIEVNTELTDPLDTDTDDDGLSDGQEVNTTLTEPLFSDTDGDSFGDNYELTHASDPLLASSTPVQPTGFALLEDFDGPGMVAGQSIQGVNGWVASDPGKATVVADPADADHELQWANGNLSKSISSAGLAILNGNTGTLFFQMHCETAIFDRSFGLSDVPNPAGPGDFEAQVAPLAGNIRVRNAAATPDTTYDIPPMQWMNVWIVTNNNTDTVKVFMETPAGQVGKIELTAAGGPYVFRNGAAANALISLCLLKFEVPESKILIDNLYVDAKAENLNNPLSSAGDGDGDGLADAWETTYFNGLGEVAAGDFDKDGTDNITEFRLGLIPNSGSSRFAATRQGNGSISWPSTAGTTFKIERSVNLGAGGWSVLQAAYPGTAVSTSYTDPAPPPTGKAFYRVTLN